MHLLDVAVQASRPHPLRGELPLRAARNQQSHDHRQRNRDQRDQCEQRADQDHHRQHADHREHRGENLAHALLKRCCDVVDVVGDPAEDVAV